MITPQIIQRFQQISYFYNHQQYAQVCSVFDSSLSSRLIPVEIWLMYAISLRRIGHLDLSKKNFILALQAYPKHAGLHNSFGNLLLEMNLPKEALEHFQQVIALEPANSDGFYNSARAYLQMNEYAHAFAVAKQANTLNPSDINIALVLADALVGCQRLAEAEQLFTRLLTSFPTNIKLLNNFGNFQRKHGEIKQAIALLLRATSANNALIYRNLAACYVLDFDFKHAYECYQKALELAPDDLATYKEFLDLKWQQGDAEPFAHIEARLSANPSHFALVVEYIRILLKVDQAQKAEQFLLPLLQQFPDDSTVVVLAVMVYRQLNELDKALSYGHKAESMASTNIAALVPAKSELGYTYLAKLDGQAAKSRFQELCQLEPNHQGWWTILSTAYRMCGDRQAYARLCNYDLVHISSLVNHSAASPLPVDFNQHLLQLLHQLHCNNRAPLGLSLQNGSQTFENIFDRHDLLLKQLQNEILREAKLFIESLKKQAGHPFLSRLSSALQFQGSWSVLLRDSGFHKSHFHPMGWLSGVYYIDIPKAVDTDGQGWLVFGKADIPNVPADYDYAIKPVAGNLVLFPSFMWHGTNPFHDSTHRITIAFDLIPE